jgi:hypothetical protein
MELFLNVLDQLVATRNGHQPIAYLPSDSVTQTLRSLTLVSRKVYHIASKYLYSHCLCLNNCTNYARLRRTLGLNLGRHPQALSYGDAYRNDALFADVPRHITSVFVCPVRTDKDAKLTTLVRLPMIIDLFEIVGHSLKRLALDLSPIYAPSSELERVLPHFSKNNIFLHMPNLEELIASYDVLDYFPLPPPNLKRLAMTFQELKEPQIEFCFSISSLQTLVFLRPLELMSSDIELLFSSYKGKSLDVVLVDVNSNHKTPAGTRNWSADDAVHIWEIDVPTSFYGDEEELILADTYIWTHSVNGTLWSKEKRRMASWVEVERRLAGPVHLIMDGSVV